MTPGKPHWISTTTVLLAALLVVSQGYLLPKVLDTGDGLDFRLIWLAGVLWGDGVSPYGPEFLTRYQEEFGVGPISHFWVYPPYWWLVSRPIAVLPFETALQVWNGLNYALLVGTAWVFARLPLKRISHLPSFARFSIALSILSVMHATPFALALGQTSFFILAGVALLLLSARRRNRLALAIGTALIMLKPNLGIFILLFFGAYRWAWPAIIAVGVAYLLASMLVLAQTGAQDTLEAFTQALTRYSAPEMYAGQPQNLTGVVHLAHLSGLDVPKPILFGSLAPLVLAVGFLARSAFDGLMASSIICAFFVPLHSYDMTFAFLLMSVLCLRARTVGLPISIAAANLLLLPGQIAHWIGFTHPASTAAFAASLTASLALALASLTAALSVVRAFKMWDPSGPVRT